MQTNEGASAFASRPHHPGARPIFKLLPFCAALLALVPGTADAPPRHSVQAIEQHSIRVPGTEYELILSTAGVQPDGPSGQALLAALETWLSGQFDLPAIHEHPRIQFAPLADIAVLRFKGFLSNSGEHIVRNDHGTLSSQHDTVALYYDVTRTIYLPDTWTGSTPVELSMLVHELVHHFQNVLGLKFECPQEREKLAYLVQDRWLQLFGRHLEDDFDLDPFSLLVKTKCFY